MAFEGEAESSVVELRGQAIQTGVRALVGGAAEPTPRSARPWRWERVHIYVHICV